MASREKIVEILQENGLDFKEKTRTITGVPCPMCGREDKFSILKANGYTICYRSSCDYGKRSFTEYVKISMGISLEEAIQKLKSQKNEFDEILKDGLAINIDLKDPFDKYSDSVETDVLSGIVPKKYPEWHMYSVDSEEGKDGLEYLLSRGLTKEIAKKLEITYSPFHKRVYFPIKINGNYYGYQGRAIKTVDAKDKVRNNEGFSRETLVMFADNLNKSEDVIIAEGPIDAIKFDLVGGYIATLGKEITNKQINLIMSYSPKNIYLALDDDAAHEMMLLADKISLPVFRIEVPESCKKRCEASGKKADFGECTFEEAKIAKECAIPIKKESLLVYLK